MNKEDIRFELDQLMKHKTIYAIEMIATSLFISTVVSFSDNHIPSGLNKIVDWTTFVGGIVFLFFIITKSSLALQKVKKLEKELQKNKN